jgi:hypothetical protein
MKTVRLYFAEPGGDSLVVETRELTQPPGAHAMAAVLVAELDRGPRAGGVAARIRLSCAHEHGTCADGDFDHDHYRSAGRLSTCNAGDLERVAREKNPDDRSGFFVYGRRSQQ